MPVVEDQFVKVSSKEVCYELLEALQVPIDGVRSIKIDVTANQPPTVTIEKSISKRDMQGFKSVIQKYAFMEFVEGQENDE